MESAAVIENSGEKSVEARRGVAGEEGDRGLSEMIETVERGKHGRGSGERWEIREKVNRVTSDRRPGGR